MKFWKLIISLVLLESICVWSVVLAVAPARNIFQKPATKARTESVNQVKSTTTISNEEEAKVRELMRILTQNATVTYPFISQEVELKQSTGEFKVCRQNLANSLFSKLLPYLLSLIVLLILIIIVILLRWLRQESRVFINQPIKTEALLPVVAKQTETEVEKEVVVASLPKIKKITVSQPPVNKPIRKKSSTRATIIDLKDLAEKKNIKKL